MANAPRKSPVPGAAWRTFQEPPEPAPSGAPLSSTLGAIAVAIGIGVVGAYMLDLHGHTCDQCGRRWRHFGAFNLGDEASHTCTRCGEVQWWKCGAPHVLRGSEFASQPPAPVAPPPMASADVPTAALAPPRTAGAPIAYPPPSYALPPLLAAPSAPPMLSAPPQSMLPAPHRPMLGLQARRTLR